MKSFNQFLYECYLSEAPEEGRPAGRRRPGGLTYEQEMQKITDRTAAEAAAKARKKEAAEAAAALAVATDRPNAAAVTALGATGAGATLAANRGDDPARPKLDDRLDSDIKKNTVSRSTLTGETGNSGTPGRSPRPYSGTTSPAARVEPAGRANPQQAPVSPSRTKAELENTLASRRAAREAAQKAKNSTALALRTQGSSGSAAATNTATKATGKGILKGLGRFVGPASAALDVADERSKGSGWLRSLAKGAVVAAGGAAGGAVGSVAGPVGTVVGAGGGSIAASKAFDTVAGANAVERKAIATANRKSQSGGEIKGIGGPTSFSQKKPGGAAFISTGSGPQRRTAQLAKTSVVTGPGGKQEVGNLAFKDGKAVYKRSDTKSLAQTSSNPFERIGRSLFAGAYKKSDAANTATKLATARSSDATRNQKLGVKLKPGG